MAVSVANDAARGVVPAQECPVPAHGVVSPEKGAARAWHLRFFLLPADTSDFKQIYFGFISIIS